MSRVHQCLSVLFRGPLHRCRGSRWGKARFFSEQLREMAGIGVWIKEVFADVLEAELGIERFASEARESRFHEGVPMKTLGAASTAAPVFICSQSNSMAERSGFVDEFATRRF